MYPHYRSLSHFWGTLWTVSGFLNNWLGICEFDSAGSSKSLPETEVEDSEDAWTNKFGSEATQTGLSINDNSEDDDSETTKCVSSANEAGLGLEDGAELSESDVTDADVPKLSFSESLLGKVRTVFDFLKNWWSFYEFDAAGRFRPSFPIAKSKR